jgi:LPS-assembly protein
MCDARKWQALYGFARSLGCVRAYASTFLLALVLASFFAPFSPTRAQDPSLANSNPNQSSFPKQKGGILGGPVQKLDKAQPLYLQGDELIYDTNNNRVIARGNVEIYFNNYTLTGDQVIYDQGANTLTAEGNAQLREPNGNIVRADKLVTSDDFRDAFVQSLSVVAKDDTRIAARHAVRREGNVTEFEQGKFTPCKNDPGKPPLWCISAARIVHDQQAATITYTDAQFELFGVPILYMPYFSHPDPSVKRRSGFLMPEYSSSTNLGYTAEIPYYFALAPNYDFTFHPQYTSKHGVLWMGDWRHRVAIGDDIRGQYTFKFAGIDQDVSTLPNDLDPGRRESLDGWRGSIETKGLFSLSSWWKFGWDITLESDDTFRRFYKLDSILQTDRVNTVFLKGVSDRNYFATTLYHFGGLLLEDQPQSESKVHPVIDYSYVLNQPVLGGELSWDANAVSLSRTGGADMSRVSFQGQWRRKIVDGIGQVWTPFAQVRGDVTSFTNGVDPDIPNATIPEDTMTRAQATAALTYAYPFVARGAGGSHVVEPIGQIVTRPASVSQRRIPDEDAKSLVWDDTLLFDVNKFSGWDRLETGTRANVGMQYTFQANSGGYARVIAGQSFHLGGENAYANPGLSGAFGLDPITGLPSTTQITNFSPYSGLETNRSDYVLGAYLAPIDSFRLVSQGRFDEDDLSLRRADVYGSYSIGPLILQAQYTYAKDDPSVSTFNAQQEVLGGLGLQLTDRWSIAGMMRYDIDDSMRLQDQIQLKYADECFVLTASYTETFITNTALDLKPDRTLMLRFELKHLGEFKYKTDALDYTGTVNQPPPH